MKLRTHQFAAAVILAAGLSTAPLMVAQDRDDHKMEQKRNDTNSHQTKRYYDSKRKEYHEWNDNEAKSYNMFLEQNHMKHHDWEHAKKSEQQRYWEWRHEHPDDRR